MKKFLHKVLIFSIAFTTIQLESTYAVTPFASNNMLAKSRSTLIAGSVMVGDSQTYTTLTGGGGLFEAINSSGLSDNVTAYITSNITEPGTNPLNQWTESGPGGYTLIIVPYSASEKVISGSVSGGMIRLNGADRVTIDGDGGFGSKYLRFRNTNGSNPTISFINDAKSNTLTNCYIESNNVSTSTASAGTVFFGTTTGTQGNDSNTISLCDIRDRSDAAGLPAYSVFSSGSTTSTAHYNSNIIVENCNIYNFSLDAGTINAGIWLDAGTTDWTITGNSIYQTAGRTQNTSAVIAFLFSNYNSANNLLIQGNYIGGTAPSCGGTALTYTGTGSFSFIGIYINAGSAAASGINGNYIQNISLTSNSTSTGSTIFRGIYALPSTGLINIGTSVGNTIGTGTGTGSITINTPLATTNSYTIACIQHDGLGNINNNAIGGITLSGAATTGSTTFYGIYRPVLTPSSAVTLSVSNNLIGSLTTANSIQQTGTSRVSALRLILTSINNPGTLSITDNTIANITDYNTSLTLSGAIYGIQNQGGSGIYAITGNTIRDLTEGSGQAGNILLNGISCTGTATKSINRNNIYNLLINQPGSGYSNLAVIIAGGSPGGGEICINKIHNITNTCAGTDGDAVIYGIWNQSSSSAYTISNNTISITNGDPALLKTNNKIKEHNKNINLNRNDLLSISEISTIINPAITSLKSVNSDIKDIYNTHSTFEENGTSKKFSEENTLLSTIGRTIYGLLSTSSGSVNIYYNTVYIGGTQPGSSSRKSYTLYRNAGTMTLRNNLFINARTGGIGNHYVIANETSPPANGWSSTASNYNTLIGSSSAAIGEWGLGISQTIEQWRTSSDGDKLSWCTTSSSFSLSSLFTNLSISDLTINTSNSESWIVSGKGIAISSETTDCNGDSRVSSVSSGVTDIGCDEFSSPSVNPPLASESGPPSPGITTAYTLWSRTLCSISWDASNSTVPAGMNVRYWSGTTVPDPAGNFGAGYLSVNKSSGPDNDSTYDFTMYFGDNETNTISSPSYNSRLARYGFNIPNPSWQAFITPGTGKHETELMWNDSGIYSLKVRGIRYFSDFAITDASNPLPVELSDFRASVNSRNVHLFWTTIFEMNNSGFDVERREHTGIETFSPWHKISFVAGNGNSAEPKNYQFSDVNLNTGTYQYRLKQKDFNGNFEYFVLNSPSNVVIGTPEYASISQNYPNPSNPKSIINYQIPNDSKVKIKVFDLTGREVNILINDYKKAGYHKVEFDGTNLASGIYLYNIEIMGLEDYFSLSKKLVLVK